MTSSRTWPVLLAGLLLAAVDLATKAAAVAWLEDPVSIGAGVSLRLVRNPGLAFGLATDVGPWVLLVVTSVVALILVYTIVRGLIQPRVAGALILAGAIANIVDRGQDGSVVDMIDIGWWPTFNLADVFIVSGVGVMLLWSFRQPSEEGPRSDVVAEGYKS